MEPERTRRMPVPLSLRYRDAVPHALLVVPGALRRLSGGNRYDREAIDALRRAGWSVDVVEPGEASGSADLLILDSLAFRHGALESEAPVLALAHQLPGEVEGGTASDAERAALSSVAAVVAVSEWLAATVRALTDVPVQVIPPGRDGAWAPDGPEEDADLVLCVGNAVPGKGVPDAIEAFLAADVPDAMLVVAGDLSWDEGEAERVRAAAEGAPDRVEVAGRLPREELSVRYRRSRLLLTASRYEGWPIAVAEAMASGLPVAGFDVPGVRELARPELDGLLAPRGDVAALAGAVSRLWSERELARRLGASARKRALAWPTWGETGGRFVEVAERVAGRRARKPTPP
jgi:glycosyltransferase involved in cell wall biosynthesis